MCQLVAAIRLWKRLVFVRDYDMKVAREDGTGVEPSG